MKMIFGVTGSVFALVGAVVLESPMVFAAQAAEGARSSDLERRAEELRFWDPNASPYRTPRSGEGFRTELFGEEVTVHNHERSSINAWLLGAQFNTPGVDDRDFVPLADLYFWRHPKDSELFYANIVGIFNELFFAEQLPEWGKFQYALNFQNYNTPTAVSEAIDGERHDAEELYFGSLRWGVGFGYRTRVAPGHNDNMFMVNLLFEPAYLYFDDGGDTADDVVMPHDTFELATRLEIKYDALERNILWLAHEGVAAGANFVYGHRLSWDDWGKNGDEFKAGDSRNYVKLDAYAVAAGGVPFVDSERHRLLGSLHGGVGHNLDRFSATRIGGGVNPMGWEFTSTDKPVLPGAAVWEYYPEHYLLATAEYRFEPLFFTYLSLHGTAGWLNPVRRIGGRLQRKEMFYSAVGGRLSTGFYGDSMLVLDYTHNFNVVRNGEHGGNEVTLFLVKNF